jgi:peptide/nickel transport system ATP-binding protein
MSRVPLLEVRDLVTVFGTETDPIYAVDGLSLSIFPGQIVGLVGESGCGKSVTAASILRLIPEPPGRISQGQVIFEGQDLLALDESSLRQIRGNKISIVFQEPRSALNPVIKVGAQVAEALRAHQKVSTREARERSVELMASLGISSPEERWRAYPHQLSGGMQQRLMLAMALICDPQLLIADEPTTSLDVTLQAQVVKLLLEQQRQRKMAVLLITHDLALVAESCDFLVVLYSGQVVESGSVAVCFRTPAHPYTAALLRSIRSFSHSGQRLVEVGGVLDERVDRKGCRFVNRCERVQARCLKQGPTLEEKERAHWVRCFFPLLGEAPSKPEAAPGLESQ